jgi:hypothetical protein
MSYQKRDCTFLLQSRILCFDVGLSVATLCVLAGRYYGFERNTASIFSPEYDSSIYFRICGVYLKSTRLYNQKTNINIFTAFRT